MDKNAIFRSEFEKITSRCPDKKLKNAIIKLVNVYGRKNRKRRRRNVDYDKPEFRTAYMYKYHDMHAQLSTMALRLIANKGERYSENLHQEAASSFDPSTFLADLRGKEILTVTSIGGGSGADLAGFYRFWSKDLLQEEDAPCGSRDDVVKNLRLTNLDFYEGWKECSVNYMRLLGADEFYRFVRVDVLDRTRENVTIVQEQMKNSDLVIMCRFLSAVYHETGLKNHIKRMLRNMKSGAYLLVVDNMYRCWRCDTLDWMLQNIPQEECSLIHSYGSADGPEITLDGDLNSEYTNYLPLFQIELNDDEDALRQHRYPHCIGLQLWQRV